MLLTNIACIILLVGLWTSLHNEALVQSVPGMLDQFINLSHKRCIDACNEELKCVWSKYYNKLKLCRIFGNEGDNSNSEPGTYIYEKSKQMINYAKEQMDKCSTNAVTDDVTDDVTNEEVCQITNCGAPREYPDAEISGNMYHIGSKVRYDCIDGSDFNTSTCEPGGLWTKVSLWCNCSSPKGSKNTSYTLQRYNSTHVLRLVTCGEGNAVKQVCQISTGQWFYSGESCVAGSEWTNIYNLTQDRILSSWKNVSSFENLNITEIKLDIISDSIVVAFMIFNGTGSNNWNWFSHERLVNSSWTDLNSSFNVSMFSINGTEKCYRRFYVSKAFQNSSDGKVICLHDITWFLVTWSVCYKDCSIQGMPKDRHPVVMYSNTTEASKFNELKIADTFTVSVK